MGQILFVFSRQKYGACRSWPAGYQRSGGRTPARVGVVTPSLPSVHSLQASSIKA